MIESLFASPIYFNKVNNFLEIQSEITECIDNMEFSMKDEWGKTHFVSDDSFSENFIGKYNLNNFSNELRIHLTEYCSAIDFNMRDYKIRSSWLSVFNNGNYGQIHSHGTVDMAGVYYYKTNGEDGDIFFESSNLNLESSLCYYNLAERWKHKPIEGKILLFPGWMKHGIMTNTTEDSRISLSFNIQFTRDGW